jgi:excinuclease ABC subunit C
MAAKEKGFEHLQQRLADLPDRPGVYLFKNERKKILYVGKAKSLRKRVRSYFRANGQADGRYHIQFLLPQIADLDTILTNTEKEALILENVLIKKYRPRYNLDLRDDKDYVYIQIGQEQFPRVTIIRRPPRKKQANLFGPYANVRLARQTLHQLQRVFPLRTCREAQFANRGRPCLNHQIGRCLGLCSGKVSEQQYSAVLAEVKLFLQGKNNQLIDDLRERMKKAAGELNFEEAAGLRDRVAAIEATLQPQQMEEAGNPIERDIIGIYREGDLVAIRVLLYRSGRMVGTDDFSFRNLQIPDEEVLGSFLIQYYSGENRSVPREILLSREPEDLQTYNELFAEFFGRRIDITVPRLGAKRRLVELADENAAGLFRSRFREKEETERTLERLARLLKLSEPPSRIECYDISEHAMTLAVGSRVVFVDGKPEKSLYRRYKIKSIGGGNDYAALAEIMTRRFAAEKLADDPVPDLLVVDGGKGQLSAAQTILDELGVTGVELAGLAKSRTEADMTADEIKRSAERIFRPGRKNPIVLTKHTGVLHLLVRLRDETHRFAITYHRKLKRISGTLSLLDEIPGIGPKKRKDLLRHFGSLRNLRAATVEEISEVKGINAELAETVYRFIHENG